MAYVQEPNPCPYFLDKVLTKVMVKEDNHNVTRKDCSRVSVDPVVALPPETAQPSQQALQLVVSLEETDPSTLCEEWSCSSYVNPDDLFSSITDPGQHHKIKWVLGQQNGEDCFIQIIAESAQQAFWVSRSGLDSKCHERGITHLVGAPYHSATNGAAECLVQLVLQTVPEKFKLESQGCTTAIFAAVLTHTPGFWLFTKWASQQMTD